MFAIKIIKLQVVSLRICVVIRLTGNLRGLYCLGFVFDVLGDLLDFRFLEIV